MFARKPYATVLLVVLCVLTLSACAGLNDYRTEGALRLEGLQAAVTVRRDASGMPYLYARDLRDALMALGFVSAQDRLFQMELTRLFAAGRIAELAGAKALALDTRLRTLGFRRLAERQARILDPQEKALFAAYVDGINAYIRSHADSHHLEFKLAGIRPGPWTVADALSILYYMGWDTSANLDDEIIAQMLVDRLGPEAARALWPLNLNPDDPRPSRSGAPAPIDGAARIGIAGDSRLTAFLTPGRLAVGSNNWAVSASRGAGDKPVVANDPHLAANILPGPWYPSALITPTLRIVGVTIPGLPAMPIFRNERVAVGITNAYGDVQDLYVERVDPRNPDHYLEGERSVPFEVTVETLRVRDKHAKGGFSENRIQVRRTRRGPVVSNVLPGLETDRVMTVRWAPAESMQPVGGFFALMTARSVDEVRRAVSQVTSAVFNFVFADADGRIGWQVSGRLPLRAQGDGTLPYRVVDGGDNWMGWIPAEKMPQAVDPQRGWVGTCNHNTVAADYPFYYSSHFAPSYRYRRLVELLDPAKGLTAEEHWRFQRDTLNVMARELAPVFAAALAGDPENKDLSALLSTWDYRDDPRQAAPTVFHALHAHAARLTFVDELGPELTAALLNKWYFWQERFGRMLLNGEAAWFDDRSTPARVETMESVLKAAASAARKELARTLGDDPRQWLWGKVHRMEFVSPIRRQGFGKGLLGAGRRAAPGSGETLYRGIYAFDAPFDVTVSASLRMVADLGDADKVLAVLPGGVSGRLFAPHTTDQVDAYMDGRPHYWWFSDASIQKHCRTTLVLEP